MTDLPVPRGLADAPLALRQRVEREQHRGLRASLVRNHFKVMDGEQALAGGLLAADLEMAAVLNAHRARPAPSVSVAQIPVVVPVAPPAEPDLRAQLGLK
ncbi:MAG: hypothetical protein JSR96_13935 [Proteobacteria bacterium]|nr:hypothetical protein [Pseudomonadota bacterium]